MNTATSRHNRVLLALACAASFVLVQIPALKADTATLRPLADAAPSLPLASSFEKVTGAENGPYVLKLKNTSATAVKASAKVLLSVFSHSDSKARLISDHVVDPGQVWTISDLSAGDKVVVTAAGFAPLEITVP